MAENSKSVKTGLDKISTWSSDWQLTLAKCCCLEIICSYKHDNSDGYHSDSYSLGGQSIPFVRETRDLGVLVDNHLSFSGHIRATVGKAKQRIYLLLKCFASRNMSILLKAYISYILPIFDYCSSAWSPCKLIIGHRSFRKRAKKFH